MSAASAARRLVGLAIFGLGLPCCAPAASDEAGAKTASRMAVAKIHASQCGNCHVPVEPGERSRGALQAALSRHHRRVHLTDDEWTAMLEYLATP